MSGEEGLGLAGALGQVRGTYVLFTSSNQPAVQELPELVLV